MITRRAGGAGAAAEPEIGPETGVAACSGAAAASGTFAAAEASGAGCAAETGDAAAVEAEAAAGCEGAAAATTEGLTATGVEGPLASGDFASPNAEAWAEGLSCAVEAAVTGGLATTGPAGGRAAIAGVAEGGGAITAEAWRGCGTILRGAGRWASVPCWAPCWAPCCAPGWELGCEAGCVPAGRAATGAGAAVTAGRGAAGRGACAVTGACGAATAGRVAVTVSWSFRS